MPDLIYEHSAKKNGYSHIAGIDEAGRGPLAGPVSAAAVILPSDFSLEGLNDSKKLTEKRREELFERLMAFKGLKWGHSFVEADEIDKVNILRATEMSMARAIGQVEEADYALIDGRAVNGFPVASEGIIKGDSKSLSIAAASIIAKVLRDRVMREYDLKYPKYGFAKHKGYGTKVHLEALRQYGPCQSIAARFHPLLNQRVTLGEGESRLTHNAICDLVETISVHWLWAQNRKVLYRNFRAPLGGEVDIVAREGKVLCFIEVKTRTQRGYGRPMDAVDKEKQALIERGANEWLRLLNRRDLPWRFDVIEIILEEGKPPVVILGKDAF